MVCRSVVKRVVTRIGRVFRTVFRALLYPEMRLVSNYTHSGEIKMDVA